MSHLLSSKPWVTTCDKYGDLSGELAGNPEGLRRLRDLIDEALAKGSVEIPRDAGFDFCSITVQSKHPEEAPSEETTKQKFAKFGCLSVLAILGLLAVAGGVKVFEIGEVR
jgi:hypothetical protein